MDIDQVRQTAWAHADILQLHEMRMPGKLLGKGDLHESYQAIVLLHHLDGQLDPAQARGVHLAVGTLAELLAQGLARSGHCCALLARVEAEQTANLVPGPMDLTRRKQPLLRGHLGAGVCVHDSCRTARGDYRRG